MALNKLVPTLRQCLSPSWRRCSSWFESRSKVHRKPRFLQSEYVARYDAHSNADTSQTFVLCGGLGSSPYMKMRLQMLIDEELKGKPELVVPPRPWSAIVRGAVIRGLEKSPVTQRRCRDHIGFTVHEKFVEGLHSLEDSFVCPVEGRRAKNKMIWHVHHVGTPYPNATVC
jgi:hypothetical protein